MDLSKRFCRKCNHRCHATVECGRCKTEAANGFGKGCGVCECPDCISIIKPVLGYPKNANIGGQYK